LWKTTTEPGEKRAPFGGAEKKETRRRVRIWAAAKMMRLTQGRLSKRGEENIRMGSGHPRE